MDSEEWDRRYTETEWIWSADPNVWVVREASPLAPGRALDLAAGEGRNSVWLAEHGWRVDAVDFSAVALNRADRLAVHQGVEITTHHADVSDFAPDPAAYDLVLLSYLHLPGPEQSRVLHTAAEAARVGGTLLLVGHDVDNLEHGTGGPQDATVLTSVEQVTGAWREHARIEYAAVERRTVRQEGMPKDGVEALDTVVRAVRE